MKKIMISLAVVLSLSAAVIWAETYPDVSAQYNRSQGRGPFTPSGDAMTQIDESKIKPLLFKDEQTGNFYYVESDGRHVTAFSPDGKILWHRNPFVDGKLGAYRFVKPIIIQIGQAGKGKIGITFNSSQFGWLDEKNGDYHDCGRD